jgi:hypothetical protein
MPRTCGLELSVFTRKQVFKDGLQRDSEIFCSFLAPKAWPKYSLT